MLGIPENNWEDADLQFQGKYFELKSQRENYDSLITLFTKEPIKINLKDVDMMSKYGFSDGSELQALKVTLLTKAFAPQGLKLDVDEISKRINIIHRDDGILWNYKIDSLMEKLNQKLSAHLILVMADSKKEGKDEYFHYKKAYILDGLSEERFMNLFSDGSIVIDFRMHTKENGTSRNHGTAFRTMEANITSLFENIKVVN